MKRSHFPSIAELAAELRAINRDHRQDILADPLNVESILDVRLQVFDGWQVWSGDPQYDIDHRGYWGCGTLDGKRFNSKELAKDLIGQAREQYACGRS